MADVRFEIRKQLTKNKFYIQYEVDIEKIKYASIDGSSTMQAVPYIETKKAIIPETNKEIRDNLPGFDIRLVCKVLKNKYNAIEEPDMDAFLFNTEIEAKIAIEFVESMLVMAKLRS